MQRDFVQLGGIPLLKILLQSEDTRVQRETARTMANLLAHDEIHVDLQRFVLSDTRVVQTLDIWSRANDIKLQSIAHRARSNLRYHQASTRGGAQNNRVRYLDGVHPLHLSTSSLEVADGKKLREDKYDVDIVFVHGLLGCPFETWMCGTDENSVWAKKWLLEDLKQDRCNPRVLSIGYDAQLLASDSEWRTMSFYDTSHDIASKLESARVGCGDRPVIFVTHSLGGIVVKQMLKDAAESSTSHLLESVSGVLFYGVPHHGSPVAQVIQAFKPRSLGIAQHPVTDHLHGTPHLQSLNTWCADTFASRHIPALSLGENLACQLPLIGVEALVVPTASANPGFGEFVSVPSSNHIDVCKPTSKRDVRYTLARDFIVQNVAKSQAIRKKNEEHTDFWEGDN